jgi:hypothetical protein
MQALALTCHPSAPCAYVRAVSVRTDWVNEDVLALCYRIEGDLDQLQLPARRPPARTSGLWQHTCFEAFVKGGDTSAYLELNVSPSGEWAIYGFDDYRRDMQPREPRHPPEIVCRSRENALEADVTVRLDGLFTERARVDALRLGVAAVLEDRRGLLSYWALAHPSGHPDFHHADSFALSLSQPGVAA